MADNSDGIGGNGGYLAITNGRVFPVSGPVIEKGTVLIKGSKIAAVGAAAEVDIPAGARVVDATGKVVMPGIVEAHCHLSVFDWGEDAGIMDRTHLHFFTRGSLEETVRDCGWTVRAWGSHMKGRYRRWYMPTRLLEPFVAVQYMLLAEKQ